MSYTNVKDLFTGICDAIRTKEGSTDSIAHQDIPDRIEALSTGGDGGAFPSAEKIGYICSGSYRINIDDVSAGIMTYRASTTNTYRTLSMFCCHGSDKFLIAVSFKTIAIDGVNVFLPSADTWITNSTQAYSYSPFKTSIFLNPSFDWSKVDKILVNVYGYSYSSSTRYIVPTFVLKLKDGRIFKTTDSSSYTDEQYEEEFAKF